MAAQSELDCLEKVRFLVENGVNVHIESKASFMVSFLWIVRESFVRTCSKIYRLCVLIVAGQGGKVS